MLFSEEGIKLKNHATYGSLVSHFTPFKSGSEMERARLAGQPSKRVACLITLETSDKEDERERERCLRYSGGQDYKDFLKNIALLNLQSSKHRATNYALLSAQFCR